MSSKEKTVEISACVPFKEFSVPNFANITDGQNNIIIPLEKLSADALDQLAGVWLERLYEKCNRDMPWTRSLPHPR